MGKATGFLEYKRTEHKKRSPKDRIKDWNEIKLPMDIEELKIQGARCMNCGVPFCQGGVILNGMVAGCPMHNLIPEWNDLVYNSQWELAYKILTRTNPFPEFTGRVCPAPCEGSCTEGHISDPVAIHDIEYEIIEKAFEEGWVKKSNAKGTGKKVVVVGAGPAGLSAAYYLNAVGHDVTVYERDDKPGGLLMYGIPNMKLDKKIVDRRIELMKQSGVKFIFNVEVGTDITTHELIDRNDAVILCCGAKKARELEVEGKDLKGVYQAIEFLTNSTKNLQKTNKETNSQLDAKGKNVIVIGGGDTGTDCVGTSIRQGCKSVFQFEIMPEPARERNDETNPWPEWPKKLKVDYGQEEAISLYKKDPRNYNIATKKLVGNEKGEIKEVHTVDVRWEKDELGRVIPIEIPNSEKIWKADLVTIAMGFLGPEDTIIDELKLKRDLRSNLKAEFGIFKTEVNKLFAAGDMRRGQSLVVWAIQEGKLAAREADKFLMGKSVIK
ncbi:MAG: glutamate synthase, small subunit [Bacillota bacterium]|nr:glutamate synthase, small subunit [Bacillota bacterium]